MAKTILYFCDICSDQISYLPVKTELQVIFTTEQTEGRSTNPYLSNQKLEICKKCMDYVLKGNYLWGNGAMGHNNYYFNNKGDKNE